MNVLMCNRLDMFSKPGGDTVQLNYTKKYLEKFGVRVDIANDVRSDFRDYDLVHIFNITKIDETYQFCINAKKQQIPIVLSPIYWNKTEARIRGYYNVRSLVSSLYSSISDQFHSFKKKQRFALQIADLILPNANIEKEVIINDFKINPEKFRIVYNGVEPWEPCQKGDFDIDVGTFSDSVLCVAAINPRKNTHRLIKAAVELGLKLILVGRKDDPYFEFCKKRANSNIVFFDHMEHPKLFTLYSIAKVHALPSLFETPGLSSLEAAISGCNIVSTNRGSAYEYFGALAEYCDPFSMDSIKNSLMAAYNKKKTNELKNHILENFTWEKTARSTLNCYKEII